MKFLAMNCKSLFFISILQYDAQYEGFDYEFIGLYLVQHLKGWIAVSNKAVIRTYTYREHSQNVLAMFSQSYE